jgi:metal-sulfur cluster biosynthetic enzyme
VSAFAAELRVDDPRLRVPVAEARAAIEAVIGRSAVAARARLRFGPGRTCERLGRLLDTAIMRAEDAGLDPAGLVVVSGTADAGEDIVRVRRKAHGDADWVTSATSQVRIVLRPAGLESAGAVSGPVDAAPADSDVGSADCGAGSADVGVALAGVASGSVDAAPAGVGPAGVGPVEIGPVEALVSEALAGVIDPDLGVDIVALGFVRGVAVTERVATLTMTLTSAACPLTSIMEDQIRSALEPLDGVRDFRIEWQWIPAWRPADITPDGRDQLRAIGFTL